MLVFVLRTVHLFSYLCIFLYSTFALITLRCFDELTFLNDLTHNAGITVTLESLLNAGKKSEIVFDDADFLIKVLT